MTAGARRLAREVTAKSVALLKNKKLLPLDAGKLRKIAVIDPYSDKIVQTGIVAPRLTKQRF